MKILVTGTEGYIGSFLVPILMQHRVSFKKINKTLPGFKCDWNAQRGAQQLFDLFTQINISADTFLFREFTPLKQLEYLIRTKQIDRNFFWSNYSA